MGDIVKRLRDRMLPHLTCEIIRGVGNDAADEIERLRKGWTRLREVDPEWVREAEESVNGSS